MIDGLKPYADRRDSGLPWLGKIPAHWEVRRNGRLFVQRNETGFPDLPILEVSLKTGVRVRDFEGTNRKQVMSDREKYKRARQGDIAYNMMRLWQGAVGTSPVDGLVSPAYVVAKPLPQTDSRYYQYLFRTGAYMDEVNKFSRGIVSDRNRLYWEDFKQMPSPFPPPEEQAAIVRFLDHADRRIRRYIRAKRQLIALLNEQKQAIIHRAVTRGLDSNVSLAEWDAEWLEEVPSHWKRIPIKRLLSRIDYGTSEGTKSEGMVRVLTMGNIQGGEVTDKAFGWLDEVSEDLLLDHCDLLFTRTNGNPELVGKIGIFRGHANERVSFASYLVRLRVKPPHVPQWLHMLLGSSAFWGFARSHALVNLQTNLNSTRYSQFAVPVPPPEEQAAIVNVVTEKTKKILDTVSETIREIELLREYRTRLVADVATGKLDVRNAAVALSDKLETDEPDAEELLDEDETTNDAELDTEPEEIEA